MGYLILSVLFSSAIFIVFKLFEKYNINTLQAIIVNYATAFCIGIFTYEHKIDFINIPNKPWYIGAVILSCLFISVFNLMALTSQKNGVSVASVAGKMSIVIPVIFGIYLYNEQLTMQKGIGIILALCAVFLTTSKNASTVKKGNYIFPILLFLGSGIIDTLIKYIQTNYVSNTELPLFSAILFIQAGVLGTVIYFFKPSKLYGKNIIAGLCLGIINYYSIIYLLKALNNKNLGSAEVFTINNVAIVMLTTLAGLFIFKEKLIFKNWIGISIAIISILLITL
ncbi:MAG: EamA family transporter [Flavobacteriaceae bacterium]